MKITLIKVDKINVTFLKRVIKKGTQENAVSHTKTNLKIQLRCIIINIDRKYQQGD